MLSSKNLIYFSLAGSVLFLLSVYSKELGICSAASYSTCLDISNQLAETLIPVVALLVLTLVIFKMRPDVYQKWIRFARWFVPLSMFLILITPEYGGGLFNPVQKGSVAIVVTALFIVISIIVIAWKSLAGRK